MATGTISGGERRTFTEFAAGWSSEALGGAAAAILAILALAGIHAVYLMPIATLALGFVLMVEGAMAAAHHADAAAGYASHAFNGGMNAEFMAGAAGIVLGILALIGLAPQVLVSASVLVFGAAWLLSCGTRPSFRDVEFNEATQRPHYAVSHESAMAASSAKAFVALAVIVLGILALTQVQTMVLTLVAQLVLGLSVLISGSTMTSRAFSGWIH
jgi:hypothetical protein